MIDTASIKTMPQLLSALAKETDRRVILRYLEGQEVRELRGDRFFQSVEDVAASLVGLSGKHIGIMGANRVGWLRYFCAVFRVGAVAVLLSPDLGTQELADRAAQADLSALVYDAALESVVERSPLPEGVERICMDRSTGGDAAVPMPEPREEDLACILFTSGTTAVPKAVMLSQRAMVAGSCHDVVGYPFRAQLAILPMHHVAGFATVLNTWYLGAVVCLGQEMKYLYRYLERLQPDYTLTVPSILQSICKKLERGGTYGQLLGWDLRMIGCGGARFQPEVIRLLNDRGIRVLQSYGATEAGGLGFDSEMRPDWEGSIGKPCPQIQTKLVGGELYLRSDSVMMGYYKDPEATAQVLKDGWYATGDLCRQDEDGYLYLQGRKREVIVLSNGENVSPEQIEARLGGHEDIDEVVVGAEADRLRAVVHPRRDSDAARRRIFEAVQRYNAGVPTYQQVQVLRFSATPFPKTINGKIIRADVTGGEVYEDGTAGG